MFKRRAASTAVHSLFRVIKLLFCLEVPCTSNTSVILMMMQRNQYKTVTVPIITYAFKLRRDGTASFLPGFEGLRPVRLFRDEDMTTKGKIWKLLHEEQRKELIAATMLMGAIRKHDSLAAKKASADLAGSKSPELRRIASEVADKIASYPQTQLDGLISARLKSAQ